jgi:hypothetical protein
MSRTMRQGGMLSGWFLSWAHDLHLDIVCKLASSELCEGQTIIWIISMASLGLGPELVDKLGF